MIAASATAAVEMLPLAQGGAAQTAKRRYFHPASNGGARPSAPGWAHFGTADAIHLETFPLYEGLGTLPAVRDLIVYGATIESIGAEMAKAVIQKRESAKAPEVSSVATLAGLVGIFSLVALAIATVLTFSPAHAARAKDIGALLMVLAGVSGFVAASIAQRKNA